MHWSPTEAREWVLGQRRRDGSLLEPVSREEGGCLELWVEDDDKRGDYL